MLIYAVGVPLARMGAGPLGHRVGGFFVRLHPTGQGVVNVVNQSHGV